jgi:hypothetical protein
MCQLSGVWLVVIRAGTPRRDSSPYRPLGFGCARVATLSASADTTFTFTHEYSRYTFTPHVAGTALNQVVGCASTEPEVNVANLISTLGPLVSGSAQVAVSTVAGVAGTQSECEVTSLNTKLHQCLFGCC